MTGTRRVCVSVEPEGGAHGDNAVGAHYTSALYVSDDGHACAEIDYYVERRDGDESSHPYDVVEMATIGEAVYEDGNVRPSDQAEIQYDYPDPYGYETVEKAQEVADRLGQRDLSFALYLRKVDNDSTTVA